VALIRHAEASVAAKDAIVLDLGDLKRQGELLKAHATKQAERILADARRRREELMADAAEEGRRQGFAQGFDEGRVRGAEEGRSSAFKEASSALSEIANGWTGAIDGFESEREALLAEARQEVIRLSVRIAEKVIKRSIEVDPGVVERQLEAILSLVSRNARLVVSVHPDDESIIRDALPALMARFASASHVEIGVDEGLSRGSVVARTEAGGEIDASIDSQLERLASAVLPGAEGP